MDMKQTFMNVTYKKLMYLLAVYLLPAVSQAAIINFHFTGRLVVTDSDPYTPSVIGNNGLEYTPISAQLSYNTDTGIGGSNLSITIDDFLGIPAVFHDITMTRQAGSNLIDGNILVDWNGFGGTNDMPMRIEWDATGLFNAIDYGLQVGDIISGTNLFRDTNGNGIGDPEEFLIDIASATPYSDSLGNIPLLYPQGPAPMAATSGSLGLLVDKSIPISGFKGYFDIGSGNSMYVTSVSTVPAPAAIWLFSSGLLGLIGIAKHKKT